MSDNDYEKLDSLFSAIEEKNNASKLAADKAEAARIKRYDDFQHLVDDIFRPEMERMCEYLKSKGVNCKVTTEGGSIPGSKQPFIRLQILPEGYTTHITSSTMPYYEVGTSTVSDQVGYRKCTTLPGRGGMTGGDGNDDFSVLSKEGFRARLIKFVTETFKSGF